MKFISTLLVGFNIIGVMYLESAVEETWGSGGECIMDILLVTGILLLYALGREREQRSMDSGVVSGDSAGRF